MQKSLVAAKPPRGRGPGVTAKLVRVFEKIERKLGNSSALGLPVAQLKALNKKLELCRFADPALCGNMEARNILKGRLDGDPDDRIAACEKMIGEEDCPDIFGEEFKIFRDRTSEFCGEPMSIWLEDRGIRTVIYKESERYINTQNGITKTDFITFLFVIVTIWLMLVMEEFRDVLNWWVVMLSCATSGDGEVVSEQNHTWEIHYLPWPLWVYQLICNLIPRTGVCCLLAYFGTNFLLHTDNYMDLILNSVALGFLVDVDDMLFAAVESQRVKDIVNKNDTIQVRRKYINLTNTVDKMRKQCSMALVYLVMMLMLSITLMFHVYFEKEGVFETAEAMECLCMMAGDTCIGAQILGGLSHVPGNTFSEERSFYVI